MSYAQRPMGDYRTYGYAGDPGFLSKLWKGVKKVARFIPGPIGTIATALGGAAAVVGATRPVAGPGLPMPYGPSFPGAGYGATDMMGRPWMTTGTGRSLTKGVPPNVPYGAPGAACPTGYHLAKDGSGRMVRNRRMNIANPRALRRAMRRVQGFEKLAKRTIQFTRRTRLKKKG